MNECCPDVPDCSGFVSQKAEQSSQNPACPIAYRYQPSAFRRPAELHAETLYVAGGLYGNRFALDQIESMAMLEARHRARSAIVFNGDFHWLDIDPPIFNEINKRVMNYVALRGNVETELAGEGSNGCGCSYPDDVDPGEVARSDRIMEILRATALRTPSACSLLGSLPMHTVAQVGEARIAIVHGDAWSLAGWRFEGRQLRRTDAGGELEQAFREADVDVFASSHTCLPAMHRLMVDNRPRAVINNGAAGIPNFRNVRHGVMTRISTAPCPTDLSVIREWQWVVGGRSLHVAALPVFYDHSSWLMQFCRDWPGGSPAHRSYWLRMNDGPAYSIDDAY